MGINLNANGMGGELSYASTTYIPADAEIRPLHDHVVIEPLDIEHSKILAVIEDIKPVRGIVKAVGKGHYPWVYDHVEKSKRTKMFRSKTFQPTNVRVGDIVELGSVKQGERIVGYSFQSFMWGNKLHLLCREADISGVVEQPA